MQFEWESDTVPSGGSSCTAVDDDVDVDEFVVSVRVGLFVRLID